MMQIDKLRQTAGSLKRGKERDEKKYQHAPTQFEQPMTNVYLPKDLDLQIRARLIGFNLEDAKDFRDLVKRVQKLNRRLTNANIGIGLLAKSKTAQQAETLRQLWGSCGVQLHIKEGIRPPFVGFDFERTPNVWHKIELALYAISAASVVSHIVTRADPGFGAFIFVSTSFLLAALIYQRPIRFPDEIQKLFGPTEPNRIDVRCFATRKSTLLRLVSGTYFFFAVLFLFFGDPTSLFGSSLGFIGGFMFARLSEGQFVTLIYFEQKLIVLGSIHTAIAEHDVSLSPTGIEIGNSKVDLPKNLRKYLGLQNE